MAKRALLKIGYFTATIPLLLFSKVAYALNWWDFKGCVSKCLNTTSRYSDIKLPKELLITLVLAEDHRNQFHFGVDQIAMCRAIFLTLKGTVQGASTIEQQFVRVVINKYQRTLSRKIFEQLLAVYVSSILKKEAIATAYLYIAYYGQSELGSLRLKSTTDIEFSKLRYSDAIAIVSRLKYPEPRKRNNHWITKFARRNEYLAGKVNQSKGLIDSDKNQLDCLVSRSFSQSFFAHY